MDLNIFLDDTLINSTLISDTQSVTVMLHPDLYSVPNSPGEDNSHFFHACEEHRNTSKAPLV